MLVGQLSQDGRKEIKEIMDAWATASELDPLFINIFDQKSTEFAEFQFERCQPYRSTNVDRQMLADIVSGKSGYAPASGEIGGILKIMEDEMAVSLAETWLVAELFFQLF